MIKPRVGFIVYGVHKDGLLDPMGEPFIDDSIIENSKEALIEQGIEIVDHDVIISEKEEAREALRKMRNDDSVDCLILFSGTWVWAGHLIAAVRDFARTGKGILIWTHPGSQGWRPVGGLVMNAAFKEVGIRHRFVYGSARNKSDLNRIVSYCQASHLKNKLNMSTLGVFGGRGMGQTCGVADPAQWMKIFGVDIDSRDTTKLVRTAENISEKEISDFLPRMKELFAEMPELDDVAKRSIRLYLALKKTVAEEKFDFYTIQSFPGLADDYTATCFAQSMMLEDGIPTSTLSDFNTVMTVFLLTNLSKERVYYGDLQHMDVEKGEIKIIGDGAVPPSLEGNLRKAGFAGHGIPTEGSAGGLSVKLVCKPGRGVLARVGREEGQFVMTVTRCTVFEPDPEEIETRLLECGIPFWPHAFVKVDCDMADLLQNWNNEYACLAYGDDIYEPLADFCDLTGIRKIFL